ncbi:unnamed protein product [Phaeothamnion confervicola]
MTKHRRGSLPCTFSVTTAASTTVLCAAFLSSSWPVLFPFASAAPSESLAWSTGSSGGAASAAVATAASELAIAWPPREKYVWKPVPRTLAERLLTRSQLVSLYGEPGGWPTTPERSRRCPGGKQNEQCCIGALSAGGAVKWRPDKCDPRLMGSPLVRYVPEWMPVQDLNPATMADVVRLLAGRRQSLVFSGDSIASQVSAGAFCSWSSAGLPTVLQAEQEDVGNQTFWLYKIVAVDYFVPYGHNGSVLDGGGGGGGSGGGRDGSASMMEGGEKIVRVSLRRAYRVLQDTLDLVLNDGDVWVLNWGLHWLPSAMEDYADTMQMVMREVYRRLAAPRGSGGAAGNINGGGDGGDVGAGAGANGRQVAIWRETSAQHHFLVPGGEWGEPSLEHPMARHFLRNGTHEAVLEFREKHVCSRNKYFPPEVPYMWRDVIVLAAAREAGLRVVFTNESTPAIAADWLRSGDDGRGSSSGTPVLYWVPFFEMTRQLHGAHDVKARNGSGGECTHFCGTPFVWEHLYDGIHWAIEADALRWL